MEHRLSVRVAPVAANARRAWIAGSMSAAGRAPRGGAAGRSVTLTDGFRAAIQHRATDGRACNLPVPTGQQGLPNHRGTVAQPAAACLSRPPLRAARRAAPSQAADPRRVNAVASGRHRISVQC